MKTLDWIITRLEGLLTIVAGTALVAMAVLTCANIVLRARCIACPIKGSVEMVSLAGALVVGCALARTQSRRENIAVDVLVSLYPAGVRRALDLLGQSICMLFAGLAAWQVAVLGRTQCRSGELTETLRIVYYPFIFAVALGFAVLTLVFLSNLLKDLRPDKEAAR